MISNLFAEETRKKLEWLNTPEQYKFTEDGRLTVEAPSKSDFFQDPAGRHFADSAPFLYWPAGDSFEMTTRLRVDMRHIYDSGCLMVMLNERNWAKLCFEFNGQHAIIVSVVTKDGVSDDCNSERVVVENPYLRIIKQNECVAFSYSPDGANWTLIRYFGMQNSEECLAGVVAQSPQGAGCSVEFEYLAFKEAHNESRF
ncbi:DUF1349 domain-containing protein [Paenibacillus alba]|uniref:DUF1349 domain-containing protein n=1 Tax=Paenibacillus alba TaxID=1197127 RepID=UPI001563BF72|nr:DUF1349 domain-containing protein [Paenibacillus alba]NQX67154.1 DUF1349 domain-containing protein [Paenibacillus alba]